MRSAFETMSLNVFSRGLIAIPLLWIGSMYICWLAATQTLGRTPRPMWDDPGGMEAGWKWFYELSGAFYMPGIPLFTVAVIGLVVAFLYHRNGAWRLGLCEVAIAVALMVLVIFSGRWFDFAYWYFD